jgi:hypothetical protein
LVRPTAPEDTVHEATVSEVSEDEDAPRQ